MTHVSMEEWDGAFFSLNDDPRKISNYYLLEKIKTGII